VRVQSWNSLRALMGSMFFLGSARCTATCMLSGRSWWTSGFFSGARIRHVTTPPCMLHPNTDNPNHYTTDCYSHHTHPYTLSLHVTTTLYTLHQHLNWSAWVTPCQMQNTLLKIDAAKYSMPLLSCNQQCDSTERKPNQEMFYFTWKSALKITVSQPKTLTSEL